MEIIWLHSFFIFKSKKKVKGEITVSEQKQFIFLALVESNAKHREWQWRNIGYFTLNGTVQENGKLMLRSLNSPVVGRLQILQGKITGHWGRGLGVVLGTDWSEVR